MVPESSAVPVEATRVSVRRFVAHFIDGTICTIVGVIAFLILGGLLAELPAGLLSDVLFGLLIFAIVVVGQVAYYVLTQRSDGRTPGKAAAGLRVVDANGRTPDTGALIKRTLPLLIEYFYVLALIGMLTSERRQRLGDRWGGTYVIRG